MAVRDYAKYAPILIITIIVILIVFVVISGISPSMQYPGKNILDIISDGLKSLIDLNPIS